MAGRVAGLKVDLELERSGLNKGLADAKASINSWGQSFSKQFETVEKIAKSVKRASHEISQAGLGVAAVAAGAVALAAKVDTRVAAQVKDLKNAMTDLAVPVAQLVVPAMKDLAAAVRSVADFVAGLSPETKSMAATFIQVGAAVGAAALVISKAAAGIGALAGVIGALASGPLLAAIGVLAGIAAGALFLHKVWRENWGGIQEKTRAVLIEIGGYWEKFTKYLGGLWDGLIDRYANVMKGVIKLTSQLMVATGRSTEAQAAGQLPHLLQGVDIAAASLKGGALKTMALDLAETVKDGFVGGFGAMVGEAKIVAAKIAAALGLKPGHAQRHEERAPGRELGSRASINAGDRAAAALTGQIQALEIGRHLDRMSNLEGPSQGAALLKSRAAEAIREAYVALQKELTQLATTVAGRMRAGLNIIGDVFMGVARSYVGKLGKAGELLNAGAQGMAAGGPIGAIIGVVVELVTSLGSFIAMIDKFNSTITKDLDKLSQALAPLFEVINLIADVAHQIFDVFGDGVLTVIKGALWILGKALTAVALGAVDTARFFINIVGGKDAGLDALKKKLDEAWNAPFEAVKPRLEELGESARKVSDRFNEMQTNLPDGLKLRAAQYAADNGTGGGLSMIGSTATGSAAQAPVYNGTNGYGGTGQSVGSNVGITGGIHTGGAIAPIVGSWAWVATLSTTDFATWMGFYNVARNAMGLDDAGARAYATAMLANAGGKGSTGNAATASPVGGGSSAFNINGGSGTPTASVGGGESFQLVVNGDLNVGASDPVQLHKKLVKIAKEQRAMRSRNGETAK